MEDSKYVKGNLEVNTTKSIGIQSDPFWLNDFSVLFKKNRIAQFFPTSDMTLIEKLNAMTRLSIFLSILLYLFTRNYHYFFIMIAIMIFTVFIFKTQKDNVELFLNSIDNSPINEINNKVFIDEHKEKIEPTVNNPFMNINLITDDKTKPSAPRIWNDPQMKDNVEDKFQYNLYRDVSDIYNKNNGQLNYYQMPSTTIPNEQTAFAKWCYATGPTCKEESKYCSVGQIVVPEFPAISTTNPYDGTVQKY
jgi:hypothetical protein